MLPQRNRLSYHQIIASVKAGPLALRKIKPSRYNPNPPTTAHLVWPSSILQGYSPSLSTYKTNEHGELGPDSVSAAEGIIQACERHLAKLKMKEKEKRSRNAKV